MERVRTLLVDDSPEFLRASADFLRLDPRVEIVGTAGNGREAVERSAALNAELVLMDLAMPEMAGLEATRRLKAGPKPPRVIVLTLFDDPEYRALAEMVKADGFVPKVAFGEQIGEVLDALLGPVPPAAGAADK